MELTPPPTAIATRAEFAAALAYILDDAVATGARELWFVDPDFEPWPLDDPGLLERLTAWARLPRRRANWLARDFEGVSRRFPRFTAWRRTWSHAVDCRATDVEPSEVPTLLLAGGGLGLLLADRSHWRGRWFRDETTWRSWREVIDALLQRSEPSFGATILGL